MTSPTPSLGRGGLSWHRQMRAIIAISFAAALLATLSTQVGWLLRFDTALSDAISFQDQIKPSDSTVLVVVDEETIRTTNRYPYDRRMVASVLDRLNVAGARRIYFDSALVGAEDAAGDAQLAAAMHRIGPSRLALPITQLSTNATTLPLDIFSRSAALVAANLKIDPDLRVRSIGPGDTTPSVAAWMLGKPADQTQQINFSIQPDAFTTYSIRDVVAHKVAAAAFAGKDVLIGLQVDRAKSTLAVPIHTTLPRVQVLGMAVESARAGFEREPLDVLTLVAIITAACALLGYLTAFTRPLIGFFLFIGVAAGWVTFVVNSQQYFTTQLPVLAPIIAIALVWQWLGFARSRIANTMRRRYMEMVGFGQTALLTAIDVIADPAFVFDETGEIIGANRAMRDVLTGTVQAEQSTTRDIFGVEPRELFSASADITSRRAELAGANGNRHFEATIRTVNAVGGRLGIAGLKDITDVVDRETRLQALAYRDGLTGLSNRVAFEAALAAMSDLKDQSFALLLIDLDGFKAVNDTYGHHVGDELLKGVASRLSALLRGQDVAARLGGDEFAVVLPAGGRSEAMLVARRLLESLEHAFEIGDARPSVGASVGIAVWPEHTTCTDTLVRLADAAMYAAKRAKPAYAVHHSKGTELFKAA